MGNSESNKLIEENEINMSQWKNIGQHNGNTILRNTNGLGQAELIYIPIDASSDNDTQLRAYKYRRNTKEPIVSTYGAQISKSKTVSTCGNQRNGKVLVQRIPKRYSQLPQLTFPQTLYALLESLKGYNIIHQKLEKQFDITEDMIGLNNQGKIKVWMNQNFAFNNVQHQKYNMQSTQSEKQFDRMKDNLEIDQSRMVINLVNVIEEKCQEGKFPTQFKQRINYSSFRGAFDSISRYVKEKGIWVPDQIYPDSSMMVTTRINQTTPTYSARNTNEASNTVHHPLASSYQPSYQHNYQPTYKPGYQPIYKPSYQPKYQPTYQASYYSPQQTTYKPFNSLQRNNFTGNNSNMAYNNSPYSVIQYQTKKPSITFHQEATFNGRMEPKNYENRYKPIEISQVTPGVQLTSNRL